MGVSRECARYWLKRYVQEGEDGLHHRSSAPTTSAGEHGRGGEGIVACLQAHRRESEWIAA